MQLYTRKKLKNSREITAKSTAILFISIADNHAINEPLSSGTSTQPGHPTVGKPSECSTLSASTGNKPASAVMLSQQASYFQMSTAVYLFIFVLITLNFL